MSKSIYIFNPDNDLCLANGDPNYLPPLTARKMEDDLAFLPAWYAGQDDFVLLPDMPEREWLDNLQKCIDIHIKPILNAEIVMNDISSFFPWGWNQKLINQLFQAGVSMSFLPDNESVKKIRQLSHRSFAV